jgi:hypothetical protein
MGATDYGRRRLDYALCRYGTSKLLFRGPLRGTSVPYVVFVGGTQTFGRYVETPFPAVVEQSSRMPCINFGCQNAGLDVFLHDAEVMKIAAGAHVSVVQVLGAHNMSNRYYSVHPRRNDRFIAPSKLLCSIYPEVDFAEFHFTRHLLEALKQVSPTRFAMVVHELQQAWIARMTLLLGRMTGPCVLLHLGPEEPIRDMRAQASAGPLFVTKAMVAQVSRLAAGVVYVTLSHAAVSEGTAGMVFPAIEKERALQLPGVRAHQEIATAVAQAIERLK